MSQAMEETSPKPKPAPAGRLPVIENQPEISGVEKWLEALRPYGNLIAFAFVLVLVVFFASAWYVQHLQRKNEAQWMQLNRSLAETRLTGKTDSLLDVADVYPDGKAGLWALQIAGDVDLRSGLGLMTNSDSRPEGIQIEEGLKQVEKARRALQKIVDAPAAQKSVMLQQRSTFSLAYALESLGEFSEAKKYYQVIVDTAPDSPFGPPAARGLERVSNPEFVALYEKFKNWEDTLGTAPGPPIPGVPDISFPELNLDGVKTGGGGDFGSDPESSDADQAADSEKAEDNAELKEQNLETAEEDKAETDKANAAESDEAEAQKTEDQDAESEDAEPTESTEPKTSSDSN